MQRIPIDITKDVKGVRRVALQPGDGTRYELMFVPCDGLEIPGAESDGYIMVVGVGHGLRIRSYAFKKNFGFLSVAYVQEHLDVSPATADAIIELLCEVLNRE